MNNYTVICGFLINHYKGSRHSTTRIQWKIIFFFRGIFHCYVSFPEGTNITRWLFPKMVVPQDGWFIMENHIKMDDLGGKPTILGNTHLYLTTWEFSISDFLPLTKLEGIPPLQPIHDVIIRDTLISATCFHHGLEVTWGF